MVLRRTVFIHVIQLNKTILGENRNEQSTNQKYRKRQTDQTKSKEMLENSPVHFGYIPSWALLIRLACDLFIM
jgi:hypothetical protein